MSWQAAQNKPTLGGTTHILLLRLDDGTIVEGWFDKFGGYYYQFSSVPVHDRVMHWKRK